MYFRPKKASLGLDLFFSFLSVLLILPTTQDLLSGFTPRRVVVLASREWVTGPFVNREELFPQAEKRWPVLWVAVPAIEHDAVHFRGAAIGTREAVAPGDLLDGFLVGHTCKTYTVGINALGSAENLCFIGVVIVSVKQIKENTGKGLSLWAWG